MTYQEMQQAEAALNAAIAPSPKQRGATKAQLEYRARMLSTPHGRCTCEDGLCDRHGCRAVRPARVAPMIASSMLRGLYQRDPDARECVVCHESRSDGEDLPKGYAVCGSCMREVIECPNCEGWFKRREFVTPSGVSEWCSECDHARDMWNQMRGVGP